MSQNNYFAPPRKLTPQHHCNFTKYCPAKKSNASTSTSLYIVPAEKSDIATSRNVAPATKSNTPASLQFHKTVPLQRKMTLKLHQVLRLPREVTLWLNNCLSELFLDCLFTGWIIPWLNYLSLTQLLLDRTIPWQIHSLTELFLDWTIPWLKTSLTDLFLD